MRRLKLSLVLLRCEVDLSASYLYLCRFTPPSSRRQRRLLRLRLLLPRIRSTVQCFQSETEVDIYGLYRVLSSSGRIHGDEGWVVVVGVDISEARVRSAWNEEKGYWDERTKGLKRMADLYVYLMGRGMR